MQRAASLLRLLPGLLLGLPGCGPTQQAAPPTVPTGYYEGTLTYRGAELPVTLQLAEDTASRLVQLLLRAPQAPQYGRVFDSVTYRAPRLLARMPGGVRLALREEPNFLTGTIWLHDTLRAELVAVRRGSPMPAAYVLTRQAGTASEPSALTLVPLDTAASRAAQLLWPTPGTLAAAYGWADWLAAQGVVVRLMQPAATLPDSEGATQLRTALQQLRDYGAAGVDSGRVGVWATAAAGRAALQSVAAGSRPYGLVVQATPLAPADDAWLRPRGRRALPVPVLGLYGSRDTALDVAGSSRQLRRAGQPRTDVNVVAGADAALLLAATADSVRRWPLPPPDLAPAVWQWLSRLPASR